MSLRLGTTNPSTLRLGTTAVSKIMLGTTEVWSAFNPLQLSPALWLSDTGSDASVWPDISGNGRNATQSTPANRPSIVTNALNGRQARRFDGSSDFMQYPSSLFSYTGANTVFCVTASVIGEAGGYGSVISEFSGIGTSIGCQTNRFPNNEFRPCTDVFGPGGIEHGVGYSGASPHIISWTWSNWSTHKTNGNTVITVDGNLGSPSSYGSNPTGFSAVARSIGRFDQSAGVANRLGFDLAELIVFPTALSSADRQAVETWLNNKWAIY